MAVSYFGGSKGIGHVVSLWGADFDSEGNVEAVYITDSDDNSKRVINNEKIGIIRYRVISDPKGGVRLTAYKDENSGGKVANIYTLSLGQNLWEKYFDNHKKMIIKKTKIINLLNKKYEENRTEINQINDKNIKENLMNLLKYNQNEIFIKASSKENINLF